MNKVIPIEVKRTCCEMLAAGKTHREIYNDYFRSNTDSQATYETFRRMVHKWKTRRFPDDTTLECGTYEGFIAHDATVQVSKTGEIVQAWIKQKATDLDPYDFIEAIRENTETVEALGLTKINKTVEMPDNAAVRGMIQKDRHLVQVEEI